MRIGNLRFNWLDALSVAGLMAALYVVYALIDRADWSVLFVPDLITLIVAMAVGIASLLLAGLSLAAIVAATGREPRVPITSSVFAANRTVLAKYLPGKVWYVVGVSESLVQGGLDRTRAWVAVGLYQTVLIGTALLFGWIATADLGLWQFATRELAAHFGHWQLIVVIGAVALLALLAAGVVGLMRHGRPKWARALRISPIIVGSVFALVHWSMQGVSIWMMLSGVAGEWLDPMTILIVPAIYAVGFLVLIAPGGIGVRELLFAQYFLYLGMPLHAAASLAIAARLAALAIEICVWTMLHVASRTHPWSGKSVSPRVR